MPAQTPLSLDDLLQVLNKATERDTLHWQSTADQDVFRAETGLGMVRVAKVPYSSSCVLSLVDDEGTLLEEFRPSGEGTQLALEALYKRARQQALNLDRKLKGLFDELKHLAGET